MQALADPLSVPAEDTHSVTLASWQQRANLAQCGGWEGPVPAHTRAQSRTTGSTGLQGHGWAIARLTAGTPVWRPAAAAQAAAPELQAANLLGHHSQATQRSPVRHTAGELTAPILPAVHKALRTNHCTHAQVPAARMDLVSRFSGTVSWAMTTANRRLLAQLLVFLLAGGLGFLTLFTRLTLGRATALRVREVFRQTGQRPAGAWHA